MGSVYPAAQDTLCKIKIKPSKTTSRATSSLFFCPSGHIQPPEPPTLGCTGGPVATPGGLVLHEGDALTGCEQLTVQKQMIKQLLSVSQGFQPIKRNYGSRAEISCMERRISEKLGAAAGSAELPAGWAVLWVLTRQGLPAKIQPVLIRV